MRSIIASHDLTAYAVAKASCVHVNIVQRFLNGSDIRLETAGRIGEALHCRIVEVGLRPTKTTTKEKTKRPSIS